MGITVKPERKPAHCDRKKRRRERRLHWEADHALFLEI